MRWRLVGLLALVCVLVLGCGSSGSGGLGRGGEQEGPLSPEKVAELENPLRAKPSLEAAKDQYRAAVTRMADAIAALVPGLTWSMDVDSWNHCGGEYVWTNAKMAYFMVGFSGPIPDDKWPQAVRIVKDGGQQFGATTFGVMKDKPGDHDVYLAGHGGVEFKLGTQVASSLTAQSDCRISETDTPSPPPPP
ncbi:LppA family lipoprotein [Mycobacterium ulcerans]|uniref:Lipoprotein n=1 Tax=Mycobacterium ulcerans subsp. shinshuense TaxID=1124626 RepID=A0A1B4Y5H0_MYCUL|nr:LppA family lipoprotein [Mycobacterium ulcerans]BAV42301.1 lipoprotein [Mycobacterium ulcerans subsp. shinshuense]